MTRTWGGPQSSMEELLELTLVLLRRRRIVNGMNELARAWVDCYAAL